MPSMQTRVKVSHSVSVASVGNPSAGSKAGSSGGNDLPQSSRARKRRMTNQERLEATSSNPSHLSASCSLTPVSKRLFYIPSILALLAADKADARASAARVSE